MSPANPPLFFLLVHGHAILQVLREAGPKGIACMHWSRGLRDNIGVESPERHGSGVFCFEWVGFRGRVGCILNSVNRGLYSSPRVSLIPRFAKIHGSNTARSHSLPKKTPYLNSTLSLFWARFPVPRFICWVSSLMILPIDLPVASARRPIFSQLALRCR